MASLLEDLVTFLIAQSEVTADGVDVFRDFEPDEPDDVVILSEYLGSAAPIADAAIHRSIQVVARRKTYSAAYSKIKSIYNKLEVPGEDRKIMLTATRWAQLHARHSPVKFKVDALNRVYFVFNIGVVTHKD